jgi:hypothetical protein
MGKTVSAAVNAVATPVKATVSSIGSAIGDGKPLVAVGNLVGVGGSEKTGTTGVIGVAKGLIVDAGKSAGGAFIADVKGNPGGAVAEGVQAYATGGASLVGAGLNSAQGAGGSIIGSLMGSSPSDLAGGGGGAPQLPSNSAPIYSGPQGADLTGPVLIGGAMLGAYLLIRRR